MRSEPNGLVDPWRARNQNFPESAPGSNMGYFRVHGPLSSHGRAWLTVISSGPHDPAVDAEMIADLGDVGKQIAEWEHVSVSCPGRCPTWQEMAYVKSLFWGDDETVIEFHPKASEYVNFHPHVLHLWKRRGVDHELPPSLAVGPKRRTAAKRA